MIVGGVLLLAVAAGLGVWHRMLTMRLRAMAGAETVSCADLAELREAAAQAAGQGAFSHVCEVVGAVQAGEHGPLTAEVSRAECVWHRHVVRRRYRQRTRTADGTRTETRTETVAELTSSQPFVVRDSSGAVLVDPAGARFDRVEQVVDRFERARGGGGLDVSVFGISLSGGDGTVGYEYEEWVLRPGQRVYVLGVASDRTGVLTMRKPAAGPYIVSTRSEEELVGSARTQRTLAVTGAALAAVAGLVLLGLGLVASA